MRPWGFGKRVHVRTGRCEFEWALFAFLRFTRLDGVHVTTVLNLWKKGAAGALRPLVSSTALTSKVYAVRVNFRSANGRQSTRREGGMEGSAPSLPRWAERSGQRVKEATARFPPRSLPCLFAF